MTGWWSYNCREWNDYNKRSEVFDFLKQQQADIYCLPCIIFDKYIPVILSYVKPIIIYPNDTLYLQSVSQAMLRSVSVKINGETCLVLNNMSGNTCSGGCINYVKIHTYNGYTPEYYTEF